MRSGNNSIITPGGSLEDSMRRREEFYAIMQKLTPVYFPPGRKTSLIAKIWIYFRMRREAARVLSNRLHVR